MAARDPWSDETVSNKITLGTNQNGGHALAHISRSLKSSFEPKMPHFTQTPVLIYESTVREPPVREPPNLQ